jgi:signal transduction histidine kinase
MCQTSVAAVGYLVSNQITPGAFGTAKLPRNYLTGALRNNLKPKAPLAPGTGLGLSICHGIVTEHGGRIYARSQPGRGATFFVELPV